MGREPQKVELDVKLLDLLYWIIGLEQPSGSIRSQPNKAQLDVADAVVAVNDEAADVAYEDLEEELLDEY